MSFFLTIIMGTLITRIYINGYKSSVIYSSPCFLLKMYHIIFLLFIIIKSEATIRLGRIENASWILNSSNMNHQYINISNRTCEQCLCQMIEMNNLTTSMACQLNQITCQLIFSNVTVQLQIDTSSILYLRTMSNFPHTVTKQQSTTTSISSAGKIIILPTFKYILIRNNLSMINTYIFLLLFLDFLECFLI